MLEGRLPDDEGWAVGECALPGGAGEPAVLTAGDTSALAIELCFPAG